MPDIGMHTVFVARENFLFLREWIEYHLALGIGRFYLYDNSDSIGRNGSTPTVNKYGIDFAALTANYTDTEVREQVDSVIEDHSANCELIPWRPRDHSGNVVYGKSRSMVDCARRFGSECEWLGFFDLDEFVFSPSGESLGDLLDAWAKAGVGGVTIYQKKFEDRFLNMGRPVTSISQCIEGIDTTGWAPKMFVRLAALQVERISGAHTIPVDPPALQIAPSQLRFNHYNVNPGMLEWARRFYDDPSLDINGRDRSLAATVSSR